MAMIAYLIEGASDCRSSMAAAAVSNTFWTNGWLSLRLSGRGLYHRRIRSAWFGIKRFLSGRRRWQSAR